MQPARVQMLGFVQAGLCLGAGEWLGAFVCRSAGRAKVYGFYTHQRLRLCIVLPSLIVVERGTSVGVVLPEDMLLTADLEIYSSLQHLVYVPSIYLDSM